MKRTGSLRSSAWDSNISVPIWKLKLDTWKLMSLIFEAVISFWTRVPRKRLCLLRSVVWRVKFSSSKSSWLLWTVSCPTIRQFLESKRRVSALICGVLFCSFSCSVLRGWCFEVFSEILCGYAVVMKCWRFHFLFNKVPDFHFDFSFHFCLENSFLGFECAAHSLFSCYWLGCGRLLYAKW